MTTVAHIHPKRSTPKAAPRSGVHPINRVRPTEPNSRGVCDPVAAERYSVALAFDATDATMWTADTASDAVQPSIGDFLGRLVCFEPLGWDAQAFEDLGDDLRTLSEAVEVQHSCSPHAVLGHYGRILQRLSERCAVLAGLARRARRARLDLASGRATVPAVADGP